MLAYQSLPRFLRPYTALSFTGSSTNKVDVGDGYSIRNLNIFTWLLWLYPTTITATSVVVGKRPSGSSAKQMRLGTAGTPELGLISRSGGYAECTADTAILVVDKWQFWGGTYNELGSTDDLTIRIYYGSETAPAAQPVYSYRSAASGTTNADAGSNMLIGNRDATSSLASPGYISIAAVVNRFLLVEEAQDWQYNPRVIPGTVGFWRLGNLTPSGLQIDESGYGNHGTVTGAVFQARGPVTMRPFVQGWRFPQSVAAGGAPKFLTEQLALQPMTGIY